MEEDKFKKIMQWNIGIYFSYSLFNVIAISHFIEDQAENPELKFLVPFSVFTISFHVFVTLILCIFYFLQRKNELAKVYLITTLLIVLIGFPICYSILK